MVSIIQRLFFYEGQLGTFQNEKGNYPGNRVLSEKDLQEHLSGDKTLGIRLINPVDQTVKAGCIDFDLVTEQTLQQLFQQVCTVENYFKKLGLKTYIEFSGRRGYHLWLFSDAPVPAKAMRAILKSSEQETSMNLEIFPSGDTMASDGTGSGHKPIKLPFGIHAVSKGRCGFISDDVKFNEEGYPVLSNQEKLMESVIQNSVVEILEIYDELSETVIEASTNDQKEKISLSFEGHPPCIKYLMESGAPEDLEYNKVNLTLARYCISKGITEDEAISMATAVAENTLASHPTEKSVTERIENFKNVMKSVKKNPVKYEFHCGYILSSEKLQEAGGCNRAKCPIAEHSKHDTTDGNSTSTVECRTDIKPMRDFLEVLTEELFTVPVKSIPTPSNWLNSCLNGGLHGGKFYVLTAPPAGGKTTLSGWLGDYAASQGFKVMNYCYEMGLSELWDCSLARAGGINSKLISCRNWLDDKLDEETRNEQKVKLATAIKNYSENMADNMHIIEADSNHTLPKIEQSIIETRNKYCLEEDEPLLIIVDYLQLAFTGEPKLDSGSNETPKVKRLATEFKRLARKTKTAILAISDITKKAYDDSMSHGKLTMSAIKDSFTVAHAADLILILHAENHGTGSEQKTQLDLAIENSGRNEKFQQKLMAYQNSIELSEKESFARVSVVKNRNNEKGEPILIYEKAYHRFQEVDLRYVSVVEDKSDNGFII